MGSSRAKDTLEARDYSKLLRANVSELLASEYNVIDLVKIVTAYRDFLCDVAEKTSRVNEQPLREGAMHAFEIKRGEAEVFAERVSKAFRMCVEKSRHAVSGKRLVPSVLSVVKVLQGAVSKAKVAKAKTPRKSGAGKMTEKGATSNAARQATPGKSASKAARNSHEPRSPVTRPTSSPSKNTASKFQTPDKQIILFSPQKPKKGESWQLPATPTKTSSSSAQRGLPASLPCSGKTQSPGKVALQSCQKRPAASSKVTGVQKNIIANENGKILKRPAAAKPSNVCSALLNITVTSTKQSLPIRSYVQACTSPKGVKRLIVEFSEKQFSNHRELAEKAKSDIVTKGLSYTDARNLKMQYLAEMQKC